MNMQKLNLVPLMRDKSHYLSKVLSAQFALYLMLLLFACLLINITKAASPQKRQNSPAVEQLFTAVKRDRGAMAQDLLDKGVNPNVIDANSGQTPMTLALNLGSMKVFSALMNNSKVNVDFQDREGETPLMIAALRGDINAVNQLIKKGAEVNKPGWTALHYVATGDSDNQLEITQIFLDNAAFIDAQSPNLTTPLMMAAMYGRESVAYLLMKNDADPLLRNQQGMTADDFAKKGGRDSLAKDIKQYAKQVRAQRRKSHSDPAIIDKSGGWGR